MIASIYQGYMPFNPQSLCEIGIIIIFFYFIETETGYANKRQI